MIENVNGDELKEMCEEIVEKCDALRRHMNKIRRARVGEDNLNRECLDLSINELAQRNDQEKAYYLLSQAHTECLLENHMLQQQLDSLKVVCGKGSWWRRWRLNSRYKFNWEL
jgi:ABC-type phosphate transport system auxiliary subunit